MKNASSTHQRNRSKERHTLLLPILLLGGVLAFLMPEGVTAQPMRWEMPDSVQPTGSLYNVDDDEFMVGALLLHWMNEEPGDSIGTLWDFARFMKVSDWIWSPMINRGDGEAKRRQYDTLLTRAQSGERMTIAENPIGSIGGNGIGGGGQMLEVFLFDSVQSPYKRWEFLGVETGKGNLSPNQFYDNATGDRIDWPWKNSNPRERTYTDSTDAGLIAKNLAIQYDPVADPGWVDHLEDNESHSAQSSFLQYLFSGKAEDRKLSIALKGHLSEVLDPNVDDTDTIFIIELVHVIPDGRKYIESGTTHTVSTYTERIVDSFAVTKGDLYSGPEVRAKYRDVSFTHDLRYRFGIDTLDGIMPEGYLDHGAGGSPVIDVKVYWTGKEEPSVRSIMLRNPTAQLMYGTSQGGEDFREEVLDVARRILHGVTSGGVTKINDPIRPGVLRFDASHESLDYGYGSYRAILRYLTDSLVYNSGADSIPSGAINHNPGLQSHALHVGGLKATSIEYGYWDFGYDGKYPALPAGRQVLPFEETVYDYNSSGNLESRKIYYVPSIAEHNGGRDDSVEGPPLLRLTADSIEMYTKSLQKGFYGHFRLTPEPWGKNFAGRTMPELASAALAAAKHGVPVHGINGGYTTVWYDTVNFSSEVYQDTLQDINGNDSIVDRLRLLSTDFVLRMPHQPEVSELRAEANLLLAVGGDAMQFYGMAADMNILGDHYLLVDDGPNGADTLTWGSEPSFGYTGPLFRSAIDTAYGDTVTLTIRNHQFTVNAEGIETTKWQGEYLRSYPGIWTGWKTRPVGVREVAERTRAIGAEMRKRRLEWRTTYSLHNRAVDPNSSDTAADFTGTRTLPSTEMVTDVTARHPVTGVIDSTWNTYVELGLFYTKTDTGANPDPLLDSNFCYLVNRRSFERPADVADTSARGRLMDTLTESRTISLRFNLPHPDTTQYAFLRVREVLPDVTPLALLGPRTGLDTIIHGDSTVELTLRPGGGALLEVTYEPGDASIVNGDLRWNNQRKMAYFDDDRYHATYVRNDSVLYRRSMRMGENPASILWEPIETVVSIDSLGTRTYNWAPSLTMRAFMGDTIATIVWTTHSLDSVGVRDVVVRDLNLTQGIHSNIWFVDYHTGTDSTQWGDAVIGAAHGGDIIAWGDSALGVLSRVRMLQPSGMPIVLSARAQVSTPYHTPNVGRWPTVPTFAHRNSLDSNVGIAWNQPIGGSGFSDIRYMRIQQTSTGGIPGIQLVDSNRTASPSAADNGRPSMDQTQDVWHRVQEGVTWVQDNAGYVRSLIWFAPIFTETRGRVGWDSIEGSQMWTPSSVGGAKLGANGDSYPNIASYNEVYELADTAKDAHFSIAFVDHGNILSNDFLRRGLIQYGVPGFKGGFPAFYAYEGLYPHGSSSPLPQQTRHAILYETTLPSLGPVLRTSRQYSGTKSRPTGYIAGGRQVTLPVSDSLGTSFAVLMHDPWVADEQAGTTLDLVPRSISEQVDSLPQVESLLRTEYFTAGDSTLIGLELYGEFRGDSGTAGSARISIVAELVDSASGMVIYQLDSIVVTAAADSQSVAISEEYDLLSGTYYIRVRLDTASLVTDTRAGRSRYPVAEYASEVEESPAAKFVRRVGPTTGNAPRLSAQPNPLSERTEISFSIYGDEVVTITVLDGSGREVARLLDGERYEAGRYAVELDAGQLPAGTYLVRLRAGGGQVVERVVLRR